MDWIHIEPEIQGYTIAEKEVISMLNDGKNYFQIAAKMRCSFEHAKEIIYDIRRKESIRMGKLTNTQRAAIYQAWKDGTTPKDLAKQYGVSDQSIYNLIKKMNNQMPPELEDVENGISNTPIVPAEIEKEISAIAEEKSENADEKSTNAEPDKLPHYIWVALDDQVSAINWEIEQREQRIAELKEELVQLEDKRYAIEQWMEGQEWGQSEQ